jgi:ATP-dependent RNA helicase HelY
VTDAARGPEPGSDPVRTRFLGELGLSLDSFQIDALDALDGGGSVVVAAPTGSGKTVVAQYAVARALAEGGKAFYTTPLKALSNQKYWELVRRHGPEAVGLLTGDNSVNGTAPVVVMTTEVLRNMIYASSAALDGLRFVILDEVHYLQNAYRGPVWEEVIIHAPAGVELVCLSATVSNAEELADWIRTVRGPTTAVIEDRRPVELHDLYLLGDKTSDRLLLLPTLIDARPNPEAAALDSKTLRHPGMRGRPRGRLFTPRRVEVVELLEEQAMLPAIYFIFSRAACDDAVAACVREGGRLTSAEERRQIRAIAENHVDPLSDDDLAVLDYPAWLTGLEAGYAAHHAGMVPPFKEAVEECFAAGLVKAVFATETLSLGINMPARSVVIEKLTKYTGERHEFLTPGEYTQLTGRAGRRGIDDTGYAVVLWSPFVPFDQVAGLAGSRSYALTSSFRPTYNMAANLVRRYPPDVAHHLLNLSFAQYRADAEVVRLEAQLERSISALAEARAGASCELGDVEEYRRQVRAGPESARPASVGRRGSPAAVSDVLERLRPGDVLGVPGGRHGSVMAVLSTARRRNEAVRLRAVTVEQKVLTLGPSDFVDPPAVLGRVEIPVPYAPNATSFRKRVASGLAAFRGRAATAAGPPPAGEGPEGEGSDGEGPDGPGSPPPAEIEQAPAPAGDVGSCPDLRTHLRALERAERLERDVERLERRVRGRLESLARQFDRVLRVLEAWGYVDGWNLTDRGTRLARLYHESDLLIAECLTAGLLDDLDEAEMAAAASLFSFESRSGGPSNGWLPTPRLRRRWNDMAGMAAELNAAEDDAGLPLTRGLDPGFASAAHAWASGEELSDVIAEEEISGGDFVRNVKQLIDLLRQLGEVAPEPATGRVARAAAEKLMRGVVAASSVVPTQ